jgi:KDO2-lipid IV(A) lauroyltransferase
MARVRHWLEYALTVTGARTAQMMSPALADRCGAALGSLVWRLAKSRREIALDNLAKAFGGAIPVEERPEIVHRVFQNIGRTMFEFARFRKTTHERIREIITGPGEDILKRVHAEGKGGILVTAHFGNWELMGSWIAACGYEMDFLTGTQHNQKVNGVVQQFRKYQGAGIIPLATSPRQAFKVLKANHFTGIASDQHAASGGVILDFMGRPASTPRGPALFAIRAGCPLMPFVLRRERYDRHVIMHGDLVYPPNSGDEDADIKQMTRAYTAFFESAIRQYPDQWMWTHRRWKVDYLKSTDSAQPTGMEK